VFDAEGAGVHSGRGLEEVVVRFGVTHHAIQVVDGVVEVVVEDDRVSVGAAETVFIPGVENGSGECLGKMLCFC
jgi:hypothetical protein